MNSYDNRKYFLLSSNEQPNRTKFTFLKDANNLIKVVVVNRKLEPTRGFVYVINITLVGNNLPENGFSEEQYLNLIADPNSFRIVYQSDPNRIQVGDCFFFTAQISFQLKQLNSAEVSKRVQCRLEYSKALAE